MSLPALGPEITALIATYGLWVLFLVVALESAGVPMPGETALVSTAIYAGVSHRFDIGVVIGVAAAAAILGDNFGYLVGRTLGLRLVLRHGGRIGLGRERLLLGQYLFLRHGGKIVFFGRFVAFLRTFAALLAGVNRMAWGHFLALNALGGVCWAALFGGGAYAFGDRIGRVTGPVSAALLAAGVVAVLAGWLFFRRHEQMLQQRAAAALAASPRPRRH
jgi:membrane protein DedA with SNARE-associated domain